MQFEEAKICSPEGTDPHKFTSAYGSKRKFGSRREDYRCRSPQTYYCSKPTIYDIDKVYYAISNFVRLDVEFGKEISTGYT